MKIDPKNLEWEKAHLLSSNIIVPRPIAFISTIGENGINNVAPYARFVGICDRPMLVAVSIGTKRDGRKKDTLVNIEFTKDFVLNVVTEDLADAMNIAGGNYPCDVDEFSEAGLTPVKADVVKSPMVAESPVNMECRLLQILEFGESPIRNSVVIGEVIRIHLKDGLYINDVINPNELKAIGRLGGKGELYCKITNPLEIKRT